MEGCHSVTIKGLESVAGTFVHCLFFFFLAISLSLFRTWTACFIDNCDKLHRSDWAATFEYQLMLLRWLQFSEARRSVILEFWYKTFVWGVYWGLLFQEVCRVNHRISCCVGHIVAYKDFFKMVTGHLGGELIKVVQTS
jgi:hypothetical protein